MKLFQQMKETINKYIIAIDPCPMCKNKDRRNSKEQEECQGCCFYYPSNFELKKEGVKNANSKNAAKGTQKA